MDELSKDRVRLSATEAQTLAEETLRRIGYDAEEARIIADHVVDAALCGYEYSGLPKILNVAEHKQLREPRRKMHVYLGYQMAHDGQVERFGHAGDLHPLRDASRAHEVDHHDVD